MIQQNSDVGYYTDIGVFLLYNICICVHRCRELVKEVYFWDNFSISP